MTQNLTRVVPQGAFVKYFANGADRYLTHNPSNVSAARDISGGDYTTIHGWGVAHGGKVIDVVQTKDMAEKMVADLIKAGEPEKEAGSKRKKKVVNERRTFPARSAAVHHGDEEGGEGDHEIAG